MTKDRFLAIVKKARMRQDAIMGVKNADYAREGDYLRNLRDSADRMGIEMRQAVGVHLLKQVDAVATWCRTGILAGEPLESRLADIANYTLLIEAVYEEMFGPKDEQPERVPKTRVVAD